LLESVVSDRGPYFAAKLIKKLNKMLEIKTKLFILFHLQTDGQTKGINQKLKQYLWFFINHRQKDWAEWLAITEFAVNNKMHSTTKVSPFIANYGRELRMGANIRRKGKIEKVMKFAERMKKMQKEAGATLRKVQEEVKWQADRGRKKVEKWKKKRQSYVEYERFSIQGVSGKEIGKFAM